MKHLVHVADPDASLFLCNIDGNGFNRFGVVLDVTKSPLFHDQEVIADFYEHAELYDSRYVQFSIPPEEFAATRLPIKRLSMIEVELERQYGDPYCPCEELATLRYTRTDQAPHLLHFSCSQGHQEAIDIFRKELGLDRYEVVLTEKDAQRVPGAASFDRSKCSPLEHELTYSLTLKQLRRVEDKVGKLPYLDKMGRIFAMLGNEYGPPTEPRPSAFEVMEKMLFEDKLPSCIVAHSRAIDPADDQLIKRLMARGAEIIEEHLEVGDRKPLVSYRGIDVPFESFPSMNHMRQVQCTKKLNDDEDVMVNGIAFRLDMGEHGNFSREAGVIIDVANPELLHLQQEVMERFGVQFRDP